MLLAKRDMKPGGDVVHNNVPVYRMSAERHFGQSLYLLKCRFLMNLLPSTTGELPGIEVFHDLEILLCPI
jgi:hypothetical protein